MVWITRLSERSCKGNGTHIKAGPMMGWPVIWMIPPALCLYAKRVNHKSPNTSLTDLKVIADCDAAFCVPSLKMPRIASWS